MCGIHFVLSTKPSTAGLSGFMRDAFHANQVRGTDSSGMFQVKHTTNNVGIRNVEVFRKAMSGTDFLNTTGAQSILTGLAAHMATVGHVRAATHGRVSDNNSHPFTAVRRDGSRIIGVHNGSLTGWKYKEDGDRYDVDSQWLYSRIAQDGILAFDAIEGAFALVWFDSNHPDHLFIARNRDRPLYWALTENDEAMIGASELGMLGWLAERNKLKLAPWNEKSPFAFPEERHVYKINMTNLRDITKTEMPQLKHSPQRYSKPYSSYSVGAGVVRSGSAPFTDPRENQILSSMRQVLAPVATASEVATTLRNRAYEKEEPKQMVPVQQQEDKPTVIDMSILSQEDKEKIAGFLGTTADLLNIGKAVDLEDPDAEAGVVDDRNFEYLHFPPASATTTDESNRAKEMGIYGLCVKFFGIMHDEDVSEMYGEFRTREGGHVVSYDSMVRNVTRASAYARYPESRTKATDMVVVGITRPRSSRSLPYILLAERREAKAQNVYNHPATYTKGDVRAQDMEPTTSRVLH